MNVKLITACVVSGLVGIGIGVSGKIEKEVTPPSCIKALDMSGKFTLAVSDFFTQVGNSAGRGDVGKFLDVISTELDILTGKTQSITDEMQDSASDCRDKGK